MPANNETYGYTLREELKTATGAYGALSWVYNTVGSRWAETKGSLTDNYAYPAANSRLSSISLGARGSRSFTYDGAGNTVTDSRNGGTVYAYDSAGRLASVTTGGVLQATYRYDVLGGQGRRVAEYDQGTGALIREYVWLDWEPLAVIEGGAIFYVRADHIGRPVFATNGTGAKVWTMSFDPFGTLIASTGNPIAARFPGQWFQAESGLHQNWMRDYDPTTGRYIQPDPLGLIDGSSIYGYARQNPGRWTDPRGEYCVEYPRSDGTTGIRCFGPQTYCPGGACAVFGGPPPLDCTCEIPSDVPPGYDYLQNTTIAETRLPSPLCLYWFYGQVRNKGPWDYKQLGRQYENFGNWNYGAMGSAAGISPAMLLGAAGWAQTQAGTSRPEWGSPFNPFDSGNGDDPRDSRWIRSGINYYRCGCGE